MGITAVVPPLPLRETEAQDVVRLARGHPQVAVSVKLCTQAAGNPRRSSLSCVAPCSVAIYHSGGDRLTPTVLLDLKLVPLALALQVVAPPGTPRGKSENAPGCPSDAQRRAVSSVGGRQILGHGSGGASSEGASKRPGKSLCLFLQDTEGPLP